MSQYYYLLALLVSIGGMAILDWRYKLAFFAERRRSLLTLAITVGLFSIWDVAGIILGIFWTGKSAYISGWFLGPEFPIEELFFLTLFAYNCLVLWRAMERLCRPT